MHKMLFTSVLFVCFFLPAVLIGYYLLFRWNRSLQNVFLFVMSIIFYACGESKFVFVMLASILFNWLAAILVSSVQKRNEKAAKWILAVAVACNLSILFVYKYLNFAGDTIQNVFGISLNLPRMVLPIGISFFTFQALSYVVDIYRKKAKVEYNPLNVGLYISFFPQLIAGPIVRYDTVAAQIRERKENWDDFFDGFARFVAGFCKKVLLANNFAIVADATFGLSKSGDISVLLSWLGLICYTFQVYYDFGGYSDMAIGLGKMFGFHFLENFNYPYISTSVTEFWRRWHISLGSWFRDYVYIPLGGSRVSPRRHLFNVFMVWLLTGIWHGANWTYIVWGLMFFVVLTVEKKPAFGNRIRKLPKGCQWLYAMLVVMIGNVIIRSDSIADAGAFFMHLTGFGVNALADAVFARYLKQIAVYMAFGALFSVPPEMYLKSLPVSKSAVENIRVLSLCLLFVIAFASLISSAYNPFIYFNF